MGSPQNTQKTIVLAIVTPADELSLVCTTSLLRLQQMAARRGDVLLDVHIVPTFLEALNTYARGDYLAVLDANVGAPPEFVFGVLDSPAAAAHPLIAGVYPLPRVDWERVSKTAKDPAATEPLSHAGNVYNVTPGAATLAHRYAPVTALAELRALVVDCRVLARMAGPDISYVENGATKYLFAHESVWENSRQNEYQTFARKSGESVVADLEAPCVLAAPAQFAGCVGMRQNGIR